MGLSDTPSRTAEDRLRHIESLTDSALADLGVEDLLVELLDRVRDVLQTDTAAVLLLDEATDELVATAARGIEEEVRQGVRIPLGRGFAGRIAARKQPVFLEHVDHTTVLNPILHQKGIRTLLGVPLLVGGRVIGVLHVGTLQARRFTDADAALLRLVADRVALATQARRSQVERAAARALQLSLVPERLPDVPGLELAARYVAGEEGGVGGDWYDIFTLPSGKVCIAIGDVVGRGLHAAVVMGRLRSTVRAYALELGEPAEVLDRVDRELQHFEPDEMATVLFATLDPTFRRLRMASAGHPAPVLALPGQPSALLDLPVGPPVGVRTALGRTESIVEVPPGAVLCFYTDGLVERRGVRLDARLDLLCRTVTTVPANDLCVTVMGALVGSDPPTDDIGLLVLRFLDQAAAPLDMTVPAVPTALSTIRAAMRRWLPEVGATPSDVNDLLVCIGEAASNAVEHAYGPRQGTVAVRLERQGSDVVATVRDTGRWRPPRGEDRGRGTLLMRHCSDELRIEHGAGGTEVSIRRRLGGGPRG